MGSGRLAVILAQDRRLAGAPGLERAHGNRGGKRCADEQELLKQNALNRPKHAKNGEQERDGKDWRHGWAPLGQDDPLSGFLPTGNAGPFGSVPPLS
jgi:hypothetical protein